MSIFYFFFTLVLFSELSNQWGAMALPASKVEDGIDGQDSIGLMLNERTFAEPALGFLMRRSTGLGNHLLSDMRMKGQDIPGPAFSRGIALLTDQSTDQFPESMIKIDRRDTDLDMLRCMIGRVYRPCWEV